MEKKKRITIATNNGILFGDPGPILQQERIAQKEIVEVGEQLPIKSNTTGITNAAAQYGKMGIKVLVPSKGDDIFLNVKLPAGWKIVPTDHAMWTDLIDGKGRKRASMFFKGAFYDRDSFVNFIPRYYRTHDYVDTTIDKPHKYDKYYCVKDSVDESILFKTDVTSEYYDADKQRQCEDYLDTNYPNWRDHIAYWD
jgi:hypothetical protein